MDSRFRYPKLSMELATLFLAVTLLVPGGLQAQSQPDQSGTETQQQDQHRAGSRDEAGNPLPLRNRDQIQEMIRGRIDRDGSMSEEERSRMRENLRECAALGLHDAELETLFPEGPGRGHITTETMLRNQERVLTMSRQGVSTELVVQKFREGRLKGATDEMLESATHRMEMNTRSAQRAMNRARDEGITSHPDPAMERRLMHGVALDLWRGLGDEDLDRLHEYARVRSHNSSCTTVDFAAAAETATQLRELGVGDARATRFAGEALREGYNARDVRGFGLMMMAAHMHGEHTEDVLGHMERGILHRQHVHEMMQEMMEHGWMGPGGMNGPGGHSPVDDVMGGGPGDHGGHHGDDSGHHGSQPGDDPGPHPGGGHPGGGHPGS